MAIFRHGIIDFSVHMKRFSSWRQAPRWLWYATRRSLGIIFAGFAAYFVFGYARSDLPDLIG